MHVCTALQLFIEPLFNSVFMLFLVENQNSGFVRKYSQIVHWNILFQC